MRPTRSDLKMTGALLVLILALACSGTATEQGAERSAVDRPAPSTDAEAVSLMVPSGSVLSIEFQEGISSAESKSGDRFRATLSEPVYVGDQLAIGAGAMISGNVIHARSSARDGVQARLNIEFTDLELASGAQVPIDAAFYVDDRREDGVPVGAPVVGRLDAPGQDPQPGAPGEETVIGSIVGAENGTAVAAESAGQEVRIPTGTTLKIRLGASVVLSAEA